MKATINFHQRTDHDWFKTMMAYLICLLLVALPSCQKDESDLLLMNEEKTDFTPVITLSSSAVMYYGPETFNAIIKETITETRNLINSNFKYFDNDFLLKVQAGNKKKIKDLEIRIDGVLVITSADLNKKGIVSKELNSLTPSSILEVKLEGNKGSSVILLIEGTIKETVVTDIDGNYYNSVSIGEQVWMAENLKTTRFRNGDLIPTTDPANLDMQNPIQFPGNYHQPYQWIYDGDENNLDDYGRLYFHYCLTDSRGVCPSGWHAPSIEEWTTLVEHLGGWEVAGGKLKETGTQHWISPNTGATNETGFTARPGGLRYHFGVFYGIGDGGNWWSSSYFLGPGAHGRYIEMSSGSTGIGESMIYNYVGMSIRCVKD